MNKKELQQKYRGKFEVYLLIDNKGKPIYAGQGQVFIRANDWLAPSSYKKFGFKPTIAFRVIVATRVEAIDLEEQVILKFKPKFNIAQRDAGVRGKIGQKRSKETRQKISKSHLGIKLSDDHKRKIREGNLGKKVSFETRQKLSQISKLRWEK